LTPALCLVHLVWAPLGTEPLERFVRSYRAHDPGTEHELVVVYNGFRVEDDLSSWQRMLGEVDHRELRLERPAIDLAAYRQTVDLAVAERYCFVNSHSEVLVDGWLGQLERHLLAPGVGMVGTGGSFESAYSSAPRPLRPFRRDFEPFPNPHIRTNGFALTRELLVSLDWPLPRRKLHAWQLESGRHGISRQVCERGLELLAIDRHGSAHPVERWYESATFRSGGQVNQMLGDNRTREYETADPKRRLQLERMAWGPTGADGRSIS
jgi:hypothetical protein